MKNSNGLLNFWLSALETCVDPGGDEDDERGSGRIALFVLL
jgi:hypothetical protein